MYVYGKKRVFILFFCNDCGLVQLEDAVDPELLFREYSYTSSASIEFKNHLHDFAKYLVKKFELGKPEKGFKIDDLVTSNG